jgi:PAS domain S-box-containing protein
VIFNHSHVIVPASVFLGANVWPGIRVIEEKDTILDQIFDSSPAGMLLTLGPRHTVARVNRRYYEIMGIQEHANEQPPLDLIMSLLNRVYESGQAQTSFEFPLMIKKSSGALSSTYFDFCQQPLFNKDREVYGILTQAFDVTEKVLARDTLERSRRAIENERRNLRTLFRHTPELVCILSGSDFVFEFVNDAHIKVLGFDASGMTVKEAQPDAVAMLALLKEIYRLGQPMSFHEYPMMIRDEIRYFNMTYSPSRDESGTIDGILALGIDVTDQVRFRQDLEQSQARFQQLADSMPQIVYVSNPEGAVKFLNARWREYTGTYDTIINTRGTIDLIHPDDWPMCDAAWIKAVQNKETFACEVRLRNHEGNYRWFLTRAVPHLINGEIAEWFGTSTDIHDQKEAAEELARSTERYRTVFQDCPVPMLVLDPNSGHILDINNMALTTYGYSREEFLALNAVDIRPPEDRESFWQTMKELHHKKERFLQRSARHQRKDGSILHVEITLRDVMFDELWLRLAAIMDITKRVAIEKQLHQLMKKWKLAKEEAERLNNLKSAFLANMSHEIRTPLGAMLGFADLLRDPNISPDEHSNYLNILVRNGEQLSIIINDILDLSKVEAGHLTLEFLDMNPKAIVNDVFTLLDIKAREKNLTLTYEPDPSTPGHITSDPVRVRQVLVNLMSNAIKFTPHGSIHARSYGERNGQGRILMGFEITDTGIGIAAEQQEQIFDMFVQAEDSTTRKFGGTGLGLALSRKLARALGGDVRVVRSEPGVGSTFLFTLTDLPELRVKQEAPEPKAVPALNPVSATGADSVSLVGLKILVVDDAPDIRSLISFLLMRAGASVDFAEDGVEGYRKALSNCYDMVLMDIQMPQMDGYTATMKLREQGYHKPIIALTAHAMTEARKKCLSVGCTGHLSKPINPSHLLGIVAFHARHG